MGSGDGGLVFFFYVVLGIVGIGRLEKQFIGDIGKECFEIDFVSYGFQVEWLQFIRWRGDCEIWVICVVVLFVWFSEFFQDIRGRIRCRD